MKTEYLLHREMEHVLAALTPSNRYTRDHKKGGQLSPQPRHWRAVVKQAREWQMRQGGKS